MCDHWARRWADGARLPDARFRDDLAASWVALAEAGGRSWSAALGDRRRQSMGALWARSEWTVDDLWAGLYEEAREQWREGAAGLVVLDTCFYDFRTHPACAGLGPIGTGGEGRGLCSQAALLLTETGQPRGLLGLWNWTRGEGSGLPWPVAEKESSRWCHGIRAVQERMPGVPLTIIMDAEGDTNEVFQTPRQAGVELLVRVDPKRLVEWSKGTVRQRVEPLGTALQRQPVAGELVLHLPARRAQGGRPAQPARQALVAVRYGSGWLRPKAVPAGTPIGPVSVVLGLEESPPAGVERVEWYLLSTARVDSLAAALATCERYGYRWRIEQAHRVLKESLRFERLQMDSAVAVSRALAVYWPLAVRALWLRYEASEAPQRPAAEVFEPDELVVLAGAVGGPPATVEEAVRGLGKLGGMAGRRKHDLPGARVLMQGLFSLAERVAGYRLAGQTAAGHANISSDTS